MRLGLGLAVGVVGAVGCNALIGLDAPEHEKEAAGGAGGGGGPDLCAGVVCSALDVCHEAGECDPATGQCSNPEAENGAPCDDGNACTQIDTCQMAVCEGSNPVVCPQADACQPGACDPATGLCGAPDGTTCDDGDVCTTINTCQAGICNPGADRTWAHWIPDTPKSWVVTGDVVVDMTTGRIWQREVPGTAYTWQDAQSYCSNLSLPGYPSGWRLPTRMELVSIVDYTKTIPAIDTAAFPGTPSEWYWSSSPFAGDSSYTWYVSFYSGGLYYSGGGNTLRVRCVR